MPSGSCLCREVKYEFTGVPTMAATCYCVTCQKISGGTNTSNISVKDEHFRITEGKLKSYAHKHESGMNMQVFFCGTCGSPLYKKAELDIFAGLVLIQTGTLDDSNKALLSKPQAELYAPERMSWLSQIEGTAQKQGFK